MQHIDMERAELSDLNLQIRRACHDLNAPLRAVRGFADLLQTREASQLTKRGQLYVQRMVSASDHMEQVVAGLQHYARLCTHQLRWEALDISAFTQNLLTTYYPLDIANDRLYWHADADVPSRWVSDSALLQTILRALVDNALLFAIDQPTVAVSWAMQEQQLQLSVSDHGIGVDAEHQQRIFQLFERLHNRDQYPGAGTGLTLVLKATQTLQGTIAIDSASDQGTSITISLPQYSSEEARV